MNNKKAGYIVFIAAIGMMLGLLTIDISKLTSWTEISRPSFVASIFGHLSAVITAFVGGKLIPENREDKQTRRTDTNNTEDDK